MSDAAKPSGTEEKAAYVKEFPLREAHHLVRDLMTPNPWIYWSDFLFHITLGWAAFFTALFSPLFSLWQLGGFAVAVLAIYRSAIFVHELAHLKKGTFKNFRLVWNILSGIPFMIPSFTYDGVHNDHHKPDVYGTNADGEYLPFATRKPSEMVVYVLLSFLIPIALAARFVLLTPISYLIPPLRKIVWERASSLTIDPTYRRAPDAIRNDLDWRQQELGACLFGSSMIALVWFGIFPYSVLLLWYLTAVAVFLLNSLRTLAAHAYRNPGDRKMTLPEQYLDSVNIPGNILVTPLWAPVGLRYHATHHLFMSMPYHNLGRAQRRLVSQLTDNSQYIKTIRSGLWPALKQIWRESSEAAAKASQNQSS